jgi:hypothetical protein
MFLQRYFAGAPLIDAYWYSVHEPGEGIFVGDPMTQPYAPKAKLNNAGQIEFTTTGLVARHVYKVTGATAALRSFWWRAFTSTVGPARAAAAGGLRHKLVYGIDV